MGLKKRPGSEKVNLAAFFARMRATKTLISIVLMPKFARPEINEAQAPRLSSPGVDSPGETLLLGQMK
jgi:hypothetical protein